MHILERLYDVAVAHLAGPDRDWQGFADDVHAVFGAGVALYRMHFGPDGAATGLTTIATSHPEILREYERRRMYEHHLVSETDMPPLEPSRRTDFLSDAEFERMGPLAEFLMGLGLYYQMTVPAMMPDGTALGLYVWRDRAGGDFDDLEKQRLALFMRHLLAIVRTDELAPGTAVPAAGQGAARPEVEAFGARFGLTPAETEILDALLEGASLRQIADTSGRTYGTVRWHVQNVLQKCQVSSQRHLLRMFYALIRR